MCQKEKQKKPKKLGNASLGTSPSLQAVSEFILNIDNQPGGWMSEEAATHTLSLAHAETQTHNLDSTTHTGGPMQLQASTETEEKRVST